MNPEQAVVVVTGGTRGLGRTLVRAFVQRGCRVAALARHRPSDPPAGANHRFVEADVMKPASLEEAAGRIVKEWGQVDVWINNAGLGRKVQFLEPTGADWSEVFDVNFQGTLNGCRVGLRAMLDTNRAGSLINIASLAGLMACPGHTAYCTSKAAVIALTRSLAVEFAPCNIRVNAIAPGPLDTEGFRAAGGDPQTRARSIPTRAMVAPDEVASACLFLAEPSTSLTGQTIVIDGGSSAIGCYASPDPLPKPAR